MEGGKKSKHTKTKDSDRNGVGKKWGKKGLKPEYLTRHKYSLLVVFTTECSEQRHYL